MINSPVHHLLCDINNNIQFSLIVISGLSMIRDLLPEFAFYNRGKQGPRLFMTDNADEERNTLKAVYPNAKHLLCSFHVLQAMWRFLLEKKTGIPKEERPKIMKLIKDMVYSSPKDI